MQQSWLKKYPTGVPHNIELNQYNSLLDMLDESCLQFSDKTAYSNMGATLSFGELDEYSTTFAAFLQAQGIKKGDRIAIQMPNLLQFPVVLFGAIKAGAIIVNTNPLYTAREMKHQFNDSGATAIVILANFAHMLDEIINETKIKTVVVTQLGDMLGWPKSWLINLAVKHIKKMVPSYKLPGHISFFEALDIGDRNKYSPVELTQDDIAFLQYTGGTTGVSKGAILTHKNIIANMLQIFAWMQGTLKPGQEAIVTALPLYHIFSLTVNCLAFMKFGAENILITNPKDIPGFIKTLKKHKFTVFTGVNTLFNALLHHPEFSTIDFSHLKISVGGGMAVQDAVAIKWKEATNSPLAQGYGLTEASPVVCCNPIDGTETLGSIGLPLPSTEVKFINEDDEEVAPGEAGELCVKGPQVMQGYWNRPDETSQVFTADGWLKTGDVAQIDEDGFCRIVDRKKDMILVSGFNVYPNEIEDVLVKHDNIVEAAAIGVPDSKSGEVVKVFVVTKGKIDKDEVISFCREHLVAYKIPKYVEFRNELPKTNVGKVLRRALKEEAPQAIA